MKCEEVLEQASAMSSYKTAEADDAIVVVGRGDARFVVIWHHVEPAHHDHGVATARAVP